MEGYEKYSGQNGDVLNEFSTVFPEGAVTYTFDPGGGLMIVRNVNTDMAQTRYGEWHLEGNRLTIFEEGNEQSYTTTVIKLTATELVTEYRSANVEDGYELYEKNTYIRKQVEELPPAILH